MVVGNNPLEYDGLVNISVKMARAHGPGNLGFGLLPAAPTVPAFPPGFHQSLPLPARVDVEASPVLLEIRSQLAALLNFSTQQAKEMEELRRQVSEQATASSTVAQHITALRTQVASLRAELNDKLTGSTGHALRANIEERRNTRTSGGKAADVAKVGRTTSAGSTASLEGASRLPSSLGFSRSPPGLSMWTSTSDGHNLERATSDSEQSTSHSTVVSAPISAISAMTSCPAEKFGEDCVMYTFSCLKEHPEDSEEQKAKRIFMARIRSWHPEGCARTIQEAPASTVNTADADAWTPLHYAALHGHASACDALLGRADFVLGRATDRNGNTALHIATLHDRGDACVAILNCDADMATLRNHFGETPVDLAKRRGVIAVVSAFAAHGFLPFAGEKAEVPAVVSAAEAA